ncbi:serine/threonine-protein phosphatase 2A activator-like [Drosophila grimshawi]|uniref:serine/threonine-protein phosphatase 2A activator-like n=1 Tax=Drosophila grimshawi TaxID=7222 RepID=UPI000C86E91B|nr:serine/threonine-protein phosphatase 2A activator-like [Drosophila grimshawi]
MDINAQVAKYLEKSGTAIRVHIRSDTELWHNSIAYQELINYINRTSNAIQGLQRQETSGYRISDTMRQLCGIFDRLLAELTASAPLVKSGGACVKQSYRNWSRQMLRSIFNMLESALPKSKCEYVGELGQYLAGSFGNQMRIDYGTGHELSFLFFLCSLFRSQILQPEDEPAAALLLFHRYLCCVRQLQLQFDMRPAGSQGAYSLDDYQFVVYLWGTAQLCYNPPFVPNQLLEPPIYTQWRKQYLLADCVSHLAQTKVGNFCAHSSQLWSITALSSWSHIYRGLHTMYLDEVVSQFNLLRHIYFGPLMPFDFTPPASQLQRVQLVRPTHSRHSQQHDEATATDSDAQPQSVKIKLQDSRTIGWMLKK